MPAKSKQQQRFMGLVRSLQKGETPLSRASGQAQEVAKKMDPDAVRDFAATPHKGLPKKVKKADLSSNPFAVIRFMKAAALSGSLRSAETALRKAEMARRQSLEDHIASLRKTNDQFRQQAEQAGQMAAETNMAANQMVTQMQTPMPPASQPQYGNMAMAGAMQQPQ